MQRKQVCAVLAALMAGCGWFDDGQTCTIGTLSCDRDVVRTCEQDDSRAPGPKGPATKWVTSATCEDDPVRGPLTCGVVDGLPQCVLEGDDGGIVSDPQTRQAEWVRVDVSSADGAFEIEGVAEHVLQGAPLAASAGVVAAVTYAGDRPVDAALMPFGERGGRASAWVRAAGATRVVLLSPAGNVLGEQVVVASSSSALVKQEQALEASLPPTLRVLGPAPDLRVPFEMRVGTAVVIEPTAEMLSLVGGGLGRLPMTAVSALTEVVFVSNRPDDNTEDGGVEGGVGTDAGIEPDDQAAPAGSDMSVRTLLESTRVWVNVSPARLEAYRLKQEERLALQLELIRRAGEAFAWVGSVVTAGSSGRPSGNGQSEPKLPQDFPEEIRDLLQARISPMLAKRESFTGAWSGLHQVAVEAGLAGSYARSYWQANPERAAIDDGFASQLGAAGPELDFAEYLAYATIQEAWKDGPCREIQAAALDQLDPRRLVPVAKLHVLWGVGALSHDDLVSCLGELKLSREAPAIVLHKVTGEAVVMTDGLEGVRTPYYHEEIHVSVTAQRDKVASVVDLMYRDTLPGVVRLKPTTNGKDERFGATFALAQPQAYSTSPASAGLLVMTEVTRAQLEGVVLLAKVKPAVYGASVFPLITIRVDKPFWPEEQ